MSDGPHPAVAAVAGFLLGGVVVDTFTNVASVLIAGGTLGGLLGAILASIRHSQEVERIVGFGGGAGVVLGAVILLVDWLVSG